MGGEGDFDQPEQAHSSEERGGGDFEVKVAVTKGFDIVGAPKCVLEVGEESGVWVRCGKQGLGGGEKSGVLSMSVVPLGGGGSEGEVKKFEPRLYEIGLEVIEEGMGLVELGNLLVPVELEKGVEKEVEKEVQKVVTIESKVDGLEAKLKRFNGCNMSGILYDEEEEEEEEEEKVVEEVVVEELPMEQVQQVKITDEATPSIAPSTPSITSSTTKRSIYFKRSVVNFGSVQIGSCGSARLQLCNKYDTHLTVLVTEPALPFVCLHKKIKLKPRSFVNLPVRFIPVNESSADNVLTAKIVKGGNDEELCVMLRGSGV